MEKNKAAKPSLRSRIANIIVVVPNAKKDPKDKASAEADRQRKFKFDLVALILKIIATLIAIFKLFFK
jgi:hypothetical protein